MLAVFPVASAVIPIIGGLLVLSKLKPFVKDSTGLVASSVASIAEGAAAAPVGTAVAGSAVIAAVSVAGAGGGVAVAAAAVAAAAADGRVALFKRGSNDSGSMPDALSRSSAKGSSNGAGLSERVVKRVGNSLAEHKVHQSLHGPAMGDQQKNTHTHMPWKRK